MTDHNRLIASAAGTALTPLGCRRVGRSRRWISDHQYWLIKIEFQPSGWSKGSYLNVGATWLWHVRKGLTFHSGYRLADFVRFESAEQFRPLIELMSRLAASEVMILRKKFSRLSSIHRHLVTELPTDPPLGKIYRAAVVAGLVCDTVTSQRLFQRLAKSSTLYDWERELQTDGARLEGLLHDADAFRAAVLINIRECRKLNGLVADAACLELINARLANE